jgi:hypothetical protein
MPDPKTDPTPGAQPAAQDDVLGEAARNLGTGALEGADDEMGGKHTPREPRPANHGRSEEDGAAKPGQDENQAGFLKDGDKRFSP